MKIRGANEYLQGIETGKNADRLEREAISKKRIARKEISKRQIQSKARRRVHAWKVS